MCLIVWKEGNDAVFTNRQFKNMISRNADGLGIMYREDGRVKVDKVLGSPKDKFKLFQKYRNKEHYAMHARLRTHGNTDLNNCHPYEIMNIDKGDPIDLYLMHNGVLSDVPDVNKQMSDTWHFVEYIIKPIAKSNLDLLWNSDEFQKWLMKKIGSSKLLLMRSDDTEDSSVLILNHDAGKVEAGCWLSNAYSTSSYTYGGNASTNRPFPMGTPQVTTRTLPTLTTRTQSTAEDTGTDKKVIDFSAFNTNASRYSITPTQDLYDTAIMLKGLPWYQIRLFVVDDPDITADIIMAFYVKNTMTYEHIIQQIKDPNTVKGIVDIVEHVSQTLESIVKTRNVN